MKYLISTALSLSLLTSSQAADKPFRILFLGDSLTEGYGIEHGSTYPTLSAKALNQEGFNVEAINAGVSGSTTSSAVSRLRWHLKVKPDLLVLALGANDGLRGIPVREVRKNLNETLALAKSNKLPVLLAGMRVPPNYGPVYTKEFFQMFQDLARDYKVPLVPFLLEGVAGESDLNLPDGIHPNEKGHQKMTQLIVPALRPFLRATPK